MKYIGHTTKEAEELLKKHGENTLYESKEYPFLKSIVSSFKEPMMVILLIACGTYYFIGKFTDFLILTISACIIFSINIFQNFKAENAIQNLKKLTQKFAEVYRDREKVRILASKIVPGDIIILNEGERIPADVIILEASNLTIDESILTGESLPVQKTSNTNTKTKKLELESLAYSGTIITSGWLIGSVYETGKETKIGKMGLSLSSLVDEEPLVKKEINSIVSKLAILGIFTCAFVFGYGFFSTGDFAKPLLNSVTLAIALVPEELPIVLVIFLALSSLKLSKKGLIIRNKSIIETLGAANVLCVDKTGTITKNKMKLAKIITLN